MHGLDRSRFHVLEDGREQTIASFDEQPPASAQAVAPGPSTPLPPDVYTNVPAYPEASAVNVLLLDALNTPQTDQAYVRWQMLQYLGSIQPGTSLAIFTLSSRLRLVEGFTTDAAQLAKVLQSPATSTKTSPVLDSTSSRAPSGSAMNDMTADMVGVTPSAIASMQQFQADIATFQTDLRVGMTLDAMQQLARYLSAISGRKNLIWFSGSFPIALDPDSASQSPFKAMRDYSDQIRATSELLAAARVAVYPVDARGLMVPSYLASYRASGGLTNGMGRSAMAMNDLRFMRQLGNEQATMGQIAEQTGGQEYINTNGLKEAAASAVENGSTYYAIGYVPTAKKLDGQFHNIRSRLDGGNYKLSYRKGYYADPPDKASAHNPGAANPITAAIEHGAPATSQIQFQARVLPPGDPLLQGMRLPEGPAGELAAGLKAPVHRYVVDLRIDARTLIYADAPDGAKQATVAFALMAYDEDGKRLNYLDRSLRMTFNAEHFAGILARGLPAHLTLDLPVRRQYLRVAVYDFAAGRAGSLEVPVTVDSR